ncbi:MAG: heme-copper oxidase subunit III [Acidimicrobiia bacterium]|nr:heme-copper oxidase subunit III [Acidimicrobiia bacterium]
MAVASQTVRRPSLLGVGVVVWLSSELMFFAGLFAAYFTLRSSASVWPPAGAELATARTGLATAVLVGSSFTMHLAVKASEAGDRRMAVRWLLVTMGLGTLFLGNQLLEYTQLPFSISSHAYGSMFYLMTGFHGLHVIGGIGFMAAVIVIISGTTSRSPSAPPVTVCAYYWHFVDVVWVVMYSTIYLLR